ncbi:MAG: hypothetical protein KJN59_12850 [Bacteroidia bacterium]|nr:hypothetical protein [Bacteroidia bacterium]
MKSIKISLLFFLSISMSAFSQTDNPDRQTELIGSWTIDLRPSPDAEGYYQSFEITSIQEKKLEGSFYGSPISEGLINTEWDDIYFAFSTSDNTYTYYHSGYLKNGRLYGISYCPGRAFTAPWNGIKMVKE